MGVITDTISIPELSRLTNKSRPTIYKWLTLYEQGDLSELPSAIVELFNLIADRGSKKDIYLFCEEKFFNAKEDDALLEIFDLLRSNKDKLDMKIIKKLIMEELNKWITVLRLTEPLTNSLKI